METEIVPLYGPHMVWEGHCYEIGVAGLSTHFWVMIIAHKTVLSLEGLWEDSRLRVLSFVVLIIVYGSPPLQTLVVGTIAYQCGCIIENVVCEVVCCMEVRPGL